MGFWGVRRTGGRVIKYDFVDSFEAGFVKK